MSAFSIKTTIAIFLTLISLHVFAQSNECGKPIPIIQKPIIFNAERIALTREYRREHYGIDKPDIIIEPKMIVLHATSYETLARSFAALNPTKIKNRPELINAGLLNVSTHFLVDKNGTIYQLMPDNWMARHTIGLNNNAIAIENVGRDDGSDLTAAQVKSNAFLVCMLKHKYPAINYLIGHYEYSHFIGSSLWLETDKNYITTKVDPGPIFMQAVREQVASLNLLHKPS